MSRHYYHKFQQNHTRSIFVMLACLLGFNSAAHANTQHSISELLNAPAQISRQNQTIYFNGLLTPDNASRLINEMNQAETRVLRVSSGGGYVDAALDIAEQIVSRQLDIEISSLCASSCANYLFVAGNKKYILPGAIVIWHGGADQKDFREYRECKRAVSTFTGSKREVNEKSIEASRLNAERERALYAQVGVSSLLTRAGQEPKFLGRNVTHSVEDMERLGLRGVTAEHGYGKPSFCKQVNKDRPSLALVCLEITPEMIAYERARVALGEECASDGTLRIRTRRTPPVGISSLRAVRD